MEKAIFYYHVLKCLPTQETPSPSYPLLHWQKNDPGVLVQVAFS